MLKFIDLPYSVTSSLYFNRIRHLSWPIWLDSGKPNQVRGRYDIVSANPDYKITSNQSKATAIDRAGKLTEYKSIWSALKKHLTKSVTLEQRSNKFSHLPFYGGALGYIGYDAGRHLESLSDTINDDTGLPETQIGIYSWALIQDHQACKTTLVVQPNVSNNEFIELQKLLLPTKITDVEEMPSLITGPTKAHLSKEQYTFAIEKIQRYINAGDCYQVNFSQRFDTPYSGDPYTAYLKLREQLPSQYSCYFETESNYLLSLSPECFLRASTSGMLETKPIKGTRPRGKTDLEDQQLAVNLVNSDKDKAENLMIVDLLRNDLSKVCQAHTVKAPNLFELESYANVHHLVSTVEGKLQPQSSILDAIEAVFPGGSITGAPKIRAMQIIEELENSRRSVYCGAIGYIGFDGRAEMNIAIRTLQCDENMMYCWGGGGIVSDSDKEQEYQESLNKVGLILNTLKQFKPTE